MTDEAAFLKAITDNPDDDGPRLVYADWLDERGDPRGEFIRVQCRLHGWPEPKTHRSRRCAFSSPDPANCDRCRYGMLQVRERELWELRDADRRLIDAPVPQPAHVLIPQNAMASEERPGLPMVIFRRGFADEVRCTLAFWREHGPALVAACPITTVRLTDLAPVQYRRYWRWFDGSRHDAPDSAERGELPSWLWPTYHQVTAVAAVTWEHPTEADAHLWLSQAALALAKLPRPAEARR